jgi:hypothetical protein
MPVLPEAAGVPEAAVVAEGSAGHLQRLFQQVAARLRAQALVRSLALGAAAAAVPFLLTRHWGLTLGLGLLAAATAWWFGPVSDGLRRTAAAEIEARVPSCRNVLITAQALLAGRLAAKPDVRAVVLDDAARAAAVVAPSVLWPWGAPLVVVAVATGVWILVALVPASSIESLLSTGAGMVEASVMPSIDDVEIEVTPPAYTGQAPETLHNPDRIAALVGSHLRVRVTTAAVGVTMETAAGAVPLTRGRDRVLSGEVRIETDGYLAITPRGDAGGAGPRRLIGVTALMDRGPDVRITEPGRDVYLRKAEAGLPVVVQGADDIGLRTLRLAYTKVAGAGESFSFTEGEVAVTLTRVTDREWSARGVLPLDTLGLDVGDMIVYRGVATDGRPGADAVESDAFIVEIVSADAAIAEGFTIDDERDKYALSQQMVILKTERLIAKASSLAPEALEDEALGIAAEQRSVRAEIVFMMGGEFEDEAVEAAHEGELSDGRLDNSGRADLGVATRAMSRASTQLIALDLKAALATERAALVAMQRALSRRRFILRTLTQREPIDDGRRLQGTLADLGRGVRVVDEASVSARVAAARAAMAAVTQVMERATWSFEHASALSDAAAQLLAADARSTSMVDAAARLSAAGEAIAAGDQAGARRLLNETAGRLTAIVSGELATAPQSPPGPDVARLHGALADALKGGGRR